MIHILNRPIKTKEVRIRFTCIDCDLDTWVGEFEGNTSGIVECPHCHTQYDWYAGATKKVELNGAN